jgi:hypothetical protein
MLNVLASTSAHRIFHFTMARRTPRLFYFSIGKSTPTSILVGSPFYNRGIKIHDFANPMVEHWFHESLKPNIPVNADLFLFPIGISSIMISALVMSSNLVLRLSSPDMPKLRCMSRLTIQRSFTSSTLRGSQYRESLCICFGTSRHENLIRCATCPPADPGGPTLFLYPVGISRIRIS